MPGVTDEDVRRARFERYVVPEIAFLARVSRSMSRSGAEAEDLAQDTLLKAFRAIDRFDGRYPRAWLARIARNTAINRDQRNREYLLTDDSLFDLEEADAPEFEPETAVIDQVVDSVLRDALDELPPAFRVVVQLVDVEAMSYQEAASTLEIPVGTVMSRLHRARKRLRNAIAGTHLDRERG